MELLKRDRCVLTGAMDMETLYTFKDFPVHCNLTLDPPETDLKADMIFDISKSSGMIQLRNIVPEDVLYNGAHTSVVT